MVGGLRDEVAERAKDEMEVMEEAVEKLEVVEVLLRRSGGSDAYEC